MDGGAGVTTLAGFLEWVVNQSGGELASAVVDANGDIVFTSTAKGALASITLSKLDVASPEEVNYAMVPVVIFGIEPGEGQPAEPPITEFGSAADSFYYEVEGTPSDRIDIGDGSTVGDGGTAGEAAGTVTDTTSGGDSFDVTVDETGMAPFTWDSSVLTVRATGGNVADVVNNFQTAYDWVALEAALLQSTVEGAVNGVESSVTVNPVTITIDGSSRDDIGVSRGTTAVFDFGDIDLSQPFTVDAVRGDNIIFNLIDSPTSWTRQGEYKVTETSFDNVGDFVAHVLSTKTWETGTTDPTWSVEGSMLTFTAPQGYAFATDQVYDMTATGVETMVGGFDLSLNEFALVTSAHSTLDAAELGDASAVSDLLSSLFDFDAVSGGTTDNSELNTSVFAVTAADKPNVTAVWAHLQSSTGDSTVDAHELSLLATVNTLGNEFALANFLPQPVFPV
jgi:hypothetical protein